MKFSFLLFKEVYLNLKLDYLKMKVDKFIHQGSLWFSGLSLCVCHKVAGSNAASARLRVLQQGP